MMPWLWLALGPGKFWYSLPRGPLKTWQNWHCAFLWQHQTWHLSFNILIPNATTLLLQLFTVYTCSLLNQIFTTFYGGEFLLTIISFHVYVSISNSHPLPFSQALQHYLSGDLRFLKVRMLSLKMISTQCEDDPWQKQLLVSKIKCSVYIHKCIG